MKLRKSLNLLLLASLFMVFHGESCLIEERETDFVIRADIPAVWHTEGTNSSGSESVFVSAATEVDNALGDLDGDAVVDEIVISGACYEVLENNGFIGAHSGNVTVAATGQSPLALLSFNSPSNAAGSTGSSAGAEVSLSAAGVNFINGRLAQYLSTRDAQLLEFTFAATWNSTPPTGGQAYDFDWKTCVVLQIKGTLTLDVFDP